MAKKKEKPLKKEIESVIAEKNEVVFSAKQLAITRAIEEKLKFPKIAAETLMLIAIKKLEIEKTSNSTLKTSIKENVKNFYAAWGNDMVDLVTETIISALK